MTGKQHYLDAHIAYRRACLNAIEYLKKFGSRGSCALFSLTILGMDAHMRKAHARVRQDKQEPHGDHIHAHGGVHGHGSHLHQSSRPWMIGH
jgi:hypothetical protein